MSLTLEVTVFLFCVLQLTPKEGVCFHYLRMRFGEQVLTSLRRKEEVSNSSFMEDQHLDGPDFVS